MSLDYCTKIITTINTSKRKQIFYTTNKNKQKAFHQFHQYFFLIFQHNNSEPIYTILNTIKKIKTQDSTD